MDNPEFLLKRAFLLETNPYKFWKLMQVINLAYI